MSGNISLFNDDDEIFLTKFSNDVKHPFMLSKHVGNEQRRSWRSGICETDFKSVSALLKKFMISLLADDETTVFNCFDKIDRKTEMGWKATILIVFIKKSKGQLISPFEVKFDNKNENDFFSVLCNSSDVCDKKGLLIE